MSEKKPVGFRMEGGIGEDGGILDFYRLDESLPYGGELLSFCHVNRRNRFLRSPKYQTTVDLRHQPQFIHTDLEFSERGSLDEAVNDLLGYISTTLHQYDPGESKSIDVRSLTNPLSEHLEKNQNIARRQLNEVKDGLFH